MTEEVGGPESTLPPVSPARRSTDLPADAPWYARWLEANLREAWKWASVRFPLAVAFLAEAYAANPADVNKFVQENVPATWWPHLLAGGCLIQLVLRVVNLGNKGTPK